MLPPKNRPRFVRAAGGRAKLFSVAVDGLRFDNVSAELWNVCVFETLSEREILKKFFSRIIYPIKTFPETLYTTRFNFFPRPERQISCSETKTRYADFDGRRNYSVRTIET